MGTRHLIAIMANGEYKVAQYGQWDGYPSGQGVDALNCLRVLNMEAFKERVLTCHWLTKEEADNLEQERKMLGEDVFYKRNPQLSRDTGAKIISIIAAKPDLGLINKIEFAGDSLFCEWAYVIDLDKATFEVFRGFNKEPLSPEERFANMADNEGEYNGIKHIATFSLSSLPSNKDFEKALKDDPEGE
jgi:hypothetical protein